MTPALAGIPSATASALSGEAHKHGGDGSEGFVLNGVAVNDFSGTSVSNAGDVNADGIDDLIIGASNADPNGRLAAGASYVVFGRTTGFPAAFELSSLVPGGGGDGSEGFVVQGAGSTDYSGTSVSAAGDVNGDGIDDLMVGAPAGRGDPGQSFVVFGRATGFPAAFDLGDLLPGGGGDGSSGFVLNGIDVGDSSGTAVSGARDVNGDGIDDLIIGADGAALPGRGSAGESYVVFGRTTGFPAAFELSSLLPGGGGDGSAGLVLQGIDANDLSGSAVSDAGDLNGDGIDDFVIGAQSADPPGLPYAGATYVIFGRTTGFPATIPLTSLVPGQGGDGSAGFVLTGKANENSAVSVSAAGDVNGDGVDDLVIGASAATADTRERAGTSYVVFGRTTGFSARFDLRTLFPGAGGDGSTGFVLKGVRPRDKSGESVSGAGDVNGDGIDDIIIGASRAHPKGQTDIGESYVVFGRATSFPASFQLASLLPTGGGDGSAGFVLQGINVSDGSGGSVSAAGDIDDDGIDDIVIGASGADPNGHSSTGQSYVVFGRTTGFPAVFQLSGLLPP